jgi:hydrogenase nickel incorporation protein HypA/HybF
VHELSLCQDLLEQLTTLAHRHGARAVSRVEVQAGLLSGVEPQLLETAFLLAREGTVAAQAELVMRSAPPRVRCGDCGAEAEAPPGDLACPHCRSLATELIGGDELILARVELLQPDT